MEEKQPEEEEKSRSRKASEEKREASEVPEAQEAPERPEAQERRRTLSQTPSVTGPADVSTRGSRSSLGAPLPHMSPRGSLPHISPRGSLPQLSPGASLPQLSPGASLPHLSPRGSLPQLSPSQMSLGAPRSLGSLGVPGEEEAEGELMESASQADARGLHHLVGSVPSHVSMPETYTSLDGGQFGLYQPLDPSSNIFQPEPLLSSSSFLEEEEEEGSHGPYAMDDPRYRGSHIEPGYGPFYYELPEPEPRELMIQNAKAYLLKTSVKCDLSL